MLFLAEGSLGIPMHTLHWTFTLLSFSLIKSKYQVCNHIGEVESGLNTLAEMVWCGVDKFITFATVITLS